MNNEEKMAAAVKILDAKKAGRLSVIKVEDKTIIASYFVICTATSPAQQRALADELEIKMAALGEDLLRVEGKNESGWLLMDFGGIIVHIFTAQQREFYDLERLWNDAPEVDISGLLTED